MKSSHLICLLLLTLLTHTASGKARTIRFGPLPMEDRETILNRFQPLTHYLTEQTSFEITYIYTDNYDDLLARFQAQEIDLIYLGPLPYVTLRKAYKSAEPVVFFKESSTKINYTCCLVTFPDNQFTLFNGKYQPIALTQPLSTCGYLSVNGLMRDFSNSLEDNYYRYLGRHDEVALAVIRGEFVAGGMKTTVAEKYSHMGLYILAETPPLPAFALIANKNTLSLKEIDAIKQSLLSFEPQKSRNDHKTKWNDVIGNGFVEADDRDYNVVRRLLGNTTIPQHGNF
ncbi:MAG: ABC transporter substrate-binding protein [Desulfobacterales bacterium]|nr:MAG: ABC transporter substrate-binding protein [Desulfobacterales bacterium]